MLVESHTSASNSLGLILEQILLVCPRYCISTPLLERNILVHARLIISMTFLEPNILVTEKNCCDKDLLEQNVLVPNPRLHISTIVLVALIHCPLPFPALQYCCPCWGTQYDASNLN